MAKYGPNFFVIDHLLRYSIRTGEMELKSGAKSDWFCDAKQTTCDPQGLSHIADLAQDLIPREATAIGGMTVGADAISYGLPPYYYGLCINDECQWIDKYPPDLRSFTVRKTAKKAGVGGKIAGALREGDKVIITEDVTTRGVSIMKAVKAVQDFGAEVILIMPVVDRGGMCGALAEAAGIPYAPLVTAPELGFAYGS